MHTGTATGSKLKKKMSTVVSYVPSQPIDKFSLRRDSTDLFIIGIKYKVHKTSPASKTYLFVISELKMTPYYMYN